MLSGYYRVMWAHYTNNVGPRTPLLSVNVVSQSPLLSGPRDYVIGPLQLGAAVEVQPVADRLRFEVIDCRFLPGFATLSPLTH